MQRRARRCLLHFSFFSLFSSLSEFFFALVHMVEKGLSSSSCLNLMCRILATLDTVLMASLMFYLAGLSLYMFCRCPMSPGNPNIHKTWSGLPISPEIQIFIKLGQGSQPDHCNHFRHNPQDLRPQLIHHSSEPNPVSFS